MNSSDAAVRRGRGRRGVSEAALGVLAVVLVLLAPPPAGGADNPSAAPPQRPLAEGRAVFEGKGCARCHAVGEKGAAAQLGPDLAGSRAAGDVMQFAGGMWNHRPGMLEKYEGQGATRPTVTPDEMTKIIAYLVAARFFAEPGDAARGREVFERRACAQCHQLGGRGGTVGPRLDELRDFMSSSFLANALWNHGPEMAARMAARDLQRPRLEGDDVADIVAYIRGGTHGAAALDAAYVIEASPLAGAAAFRRKGCVQCHAVASMGGTVGPDLGVLQGRARVGEMAAVLWNHGPQMWAKMQERGVPFPTLTDVEMANLLAYLSFVQYVRPGGNAERGSALYREKSCVSCHAATEGKGSLATSEAARSPFYWAAAMWNHPAMEKAGAAGPPPAARFAGDEMRDLVEFIRVSAEGK